MIESIYLLGVCLLLLILSVALLCWQIGRLLESLDNVYRREEMLYRICTGGMLDYNRKVKPMRKTKVAKKMDDGNGCVGWIVIGILCAAVALIMFMSGEVAL